MDRFSRQKINKDIVEPNSTFSQLDQIDISPTTEKHIFFSSSHGTFTKIDNITGHKTHLNKFKSIGVIQRIL